MRKNHFDKVMNKAREWAGKESQHIIKDLFAVSGVELTNEMVDSFLKEAEENRKGE